MDFCLTLHAWLREVTSHCRLMLIRSEVQEKTACRALQIKQGGEIEDFVFQDMCLDDLAASLQTF